MCSLSSICRYTLHHLDLDPDPSPTRTRTRPLINKTLRSPMCRFLPRRRTLSLLAVTLTLVLTACTPLGSLLIVPSASFVLHSREIRRLCIGHALPAMA